MKIKTTTTKDINISPNSDSFVGFIPEGSEVEASVKGDTALVEYEGRFIFTAASNLILDK